MMAIDINMQDLLDILNEGRAHVKVEMSAEDLKELFGVCDATLWHWANKGILKPVKTGNKIMYPEYEVRKALGQRNINIQAP